ncbi:serine protease [Xanthobacter flavus]|uniref:Serine protease n=2 Tax=Xanthobacter flavus TaxID=281 RepID=A0A9W6FJ09_XANFL|nr:serine protease [Xanthobacter flavus]
MELMRIFVGAILSLVVCASAAARTLASYNIAGWELNAFADDKTGRFSSCIASARYNSGVSVFFMIDSDFRWYAGLKGNKIRVIDDRRYDFLLKIDDGQVYNFSGISAGRDMVIVPLQNNSGIFQEMRRGRMLYTKVAGELTSFRLDGTSRMLAALLDCVRYKGQLSDPPAAGPATGGEATAGASQKPAGPSRGTIQTGSGFFVNDRGAGITNAHVVADCKSATISGYGPARIVARDAINDMALVQASGDPKTPYAKIRRKPLQLGEAVFVMGFPLAGQLDNGLNFTSGLVSSLAGMGNDARLLQFTAPIQPGNSGGPIVDNGGSIVGVIQSKLSEVASLQNNGSLPQNINFGIKADLAANFMRANGVDPTDVDTAPPQEATAVAREGRGYTFQIKCTVE